MENCVRNCLGKTRLISNCGKGSFLLKRRRIEIAVLLLFMLLAQMTTAQSGLCTPDVTFFHVDLSDDPDNRWDSPADVRSGLCCNSAWPDKCIEFELVLHENVLAINLEIISGAKPSGSMYYQLECGPPVAVGTPICVDGGGTKTITFCKPGDNLNRYRITTIPGPKGGPDDTASEACNAKIYVTGLDPSTIKWSDLTGSGVYENLLSCTQGCEEVTVAYSANAPAWVDYQVCGTPLVKTCLSDPWFCDKIRVYFIPPMQVNISPNPAAFCANTTGVLLKAQFTGGDGNYSYYWTNKSGTVLSTGSTTYLASQPGDYTFVLSDGTAPECPSKSATVTVTKDPAPSVDVGEDITVCADDPIVRLTAQATGSGGKWSGGNGIFSPDANALNVTYEPTQSEIDNGLVNLTYHTTGNGACMAAFDNIQITYTQPITANLSAEPLCLNSTTTITAEVNGGTPPYSFQWNTGELTPSIDKPAGTYTVLINDAITNGCVAVKSITIKKYPPVDVTITSSSPAVSCKSASTLNALVSGGSGNYQYQWSTGETTPQISVGTGTYKLTVTDENGCSATDQFSLIAANSSLNAVIPQTQPAVCKGSKTNISVIASGGFGNYTYEWNNGQTTSIISVGPGQYCVTVSDSAGCNATTCVNVSELAVPNVLIPPVSTLCYGTSATLTPQVFGGNPSYKYEWSTGETSPTISKPAGTYEVIVSDANKCSDTASITLDEFGRIEIGLSKTNVSCAGSNTGSIASQVSGGASPFAYFWSPIGGTGPEARSLPAGNYKLTVTDANGCRTSDSTTVTEPDSLNVTTSVINHLSCKGGQNGTAQVEATGGNAPYIYQWVSTGVSTAVTGNLPAGKHTVWVTDQNGCMENATVIITQPEQLSVSATHVQDASCNGNNDARADLEVSGGTKPYTYTWLPSGGNDSSASQLTAGIYKVNIQDRNGCIDSVEIEIGEPEPLSVKVKGKDISCSGDKDGEASIEVNGGTAPYNYTWYPSGDTTASITNLSGGIYTVVVTDKNECLEQDTVVLNENPPLTASTSPDITILCDSTVQLYVTANGGDGDYTFIWNNGSDQDTLNNITAGKYAVFVLDGKGCQAEDSVIVSTKDSPLNVEIDAPEYICNDNPVKITAYVTGAKGIYSLQWNTGETTPSIYVKPGKYCATVYDEDNCGYTSCIELKKDSFYVDVSPDTVCMGEIANITAIPIIGSGPYDYQWSTGETTQSISKPAGSYSLMVKNGHSCILTQDVTVYEANPMVIDFANIKDVSCYNGSNGSITTAVSGGKPPFDYSWSPIASSGESIYKLRAGMYSVSITDAMGCSQEAKVEIRQPAAPMRVDKVISNDVVCHGDATGSALVSVTGGVPPYNYIWWATNDTTPHVSGLTAGTYKVSVGDLNGCLLTESISILEPGSVVDAKLTHHGDVSCYGANDGNLFVTTTGGNPPYTYYWAHTPTNSPVAANLGPGSYHVTVTDSKGCLDSINNVTIDEPSLLKATITENTMVSCNGGSDGAAKVNVSGGTPPYTYRWLPYGGVTKTATSLTAGDYSVQITDANGCSSIAKVKIGIISAPSASFKATNACIGSAVSFINKSSPGSYTWDFGDGATSAGTNPKHMYMVAGVYNVCLLVRLNGCVDYQCKQVEITAPPTACFSDSLIGCAPFMASFTNCSSNADSSYWDFGDGTTSSEWEPDHIYAEEGCYDVTLTVFSSSGCPSTYTSACHIKVHDRPDADFMVDPMQASVMEPVFNFTDLSTDAISWNWEFEDTITSKMQNPSHSFNSSGEHCVELTVTNRYGCQDSTIKCIDVLPNWSFYVPNAFTPNGRGGNETFIGKGIGLLEHRMWILDRWGKVVYYTDDLQGDIVPWNGMIDGKPAEEDSYNYKVEVKDIFGEYHNYLGHVSIIR